MDARAWLFVIAAAAAVLLVAWQYNSLSHKRIRCKEAWNQLQVLLARRHDLVGELLLRLEGRVSEPLLEHLRQARTAAIDGGPPARQATAQGDLTAAMEAALAAAPAGDAQIAAIQDELTSTDNRLAFARRQYNDFAAVYNAARRSLAAKPLAALLHMEAQEYFEQHSPSDRQASPPV